MAKHHPMGHMVEVNSAAMQRSTQLGPPRVNRGCLHRFEYYGTISRMIISSPPMAQLRRGELSTWLAIWRFFLSLLRRGQTPHRQPTFSGFWAEGLENMGGKEKVEKCSPALAGNGMVPFLLTNMQTRGPKSRVMAAIRSMG